MRKNMVGLLLIFFIIFCLIGCDKKIEKEPTLLIDVNQFARITPDELIQIMGQPDSTENWKNQTVNGTFPTIIYHYGDGKYEFFIIDNSVMRMNIRSDKYYDEDAESIKYTTENSILDMLNIDSDNEHIKKVGDTGYALRFRPASDNVEDLWCSLMDEKSKTIDEIKVTYDLNYFN